MGRAVRAGPFRCEEPGGPGRAVVSEERCGPGGAVVGESRAVRGGARVNLRCSRIGPAGCECGPGSSR